MTVKAVLATIAVLTFLLPAAAWAQGRTTGSINGTVRDASGAVVPKAGLTLIDLGTGLTFETTSGTDGGFVFPNLQPGRYTITATLTGFQPVTLQEVIVQTARSTDVVVQFQVAGVTEQVQVEGRTEVIETTSTTVANTVRNAEIAKLPLAGRNVLNFALLVPGAAQSAGARDSEYNGLPGGAINITLDGVNNNSQRFRSGGTSFFVFAPVRLGARRGSHDLDRGTDRRSGCRRRRADPVRDQARHQHVPRSGVRHGSERRAERQEPGEQARQLPKTRLRQHEYGANIGGPIIQNKLFFFANYEQIYSPSESTQDRTILTPEAQQGVFRYSATDGIGSDQSTCWTSRAPTDSQAQSIRSSSRSFRSSTALCRRAMSPHRQLCIRTPSGSSIRTCRT